MANRREFKRAPKVAMVKRATRNGAVWCELNGCGPLKKWHYHHIVEEELVIDKSKPLTEDDGLLVCLPCHTEITATQSIPRVRKATRREAAHLGVRREKKPIPSRGFAKRERAHEGRAPANGKTAIQRRFER